MTGNMINSIIWPYKDIDFHRGILGDLAKTTSIAAELCIAGAISV
jgi:hypothetical protein